LEKRRRFILVCRPQPFHQKVREREREVNDAAEATTLFEGGT
jgi:hypothetical protein